jgi:hypothetical protein
MTRFVRIALCCIAALFVLYYGGAFIEKQFNHKPWGAVTVVYGNNDVTHPVGSNLNLALDSKDEWWKCLSEGAQSYTLTESGTTSYLDLLYVSPPSVIENLPDMGICVFDATSYHYQAHFTVKNIQIGNKLVIRRNGEEVEYTFIALKKDTVGLIQTKAASWSDSDYIQDYSIVYAQLPSVGYAPALRDMLATKYPIIKIAPDTANASALSFTSPLTIVQMCEVIGGLKNNTALGVVTLHNGTGKRICYLNQ